MELLSLQVSAFFGVGQWRYRPTFTDVDGDGLIELRLRLEHDPVDELMPTDLSGLPRHEVLEYRYDPRESRYVVNYQTE